jgi:bifunctional non-homologous end joining protein LigD
LLRDDGGALQSRPIKRRDKAQPRLPFDPFPSKVDIALCDLRTKPPVGPEWGWEVKWDGYRLTAFIEPNGVKLVTRGGFDWADRFPSIAAVARDLGPASMIIDGEAVVLDDQGRSDFSALQSSLGAVGRRSGNLKSGAVLMAFDLLYLDGHDLRGMEYSTRRHLLEDVLDGMNGAIRLSEQLETDDPTALLDHACRLGLEGIVGKHRDKPYRAGKTGDWLKCKCVQGDGFVIVGYEPSRSAPGAFASLLLAAYKGDELAYVGSVGTGFKSLQAVALRATMDKLPWLRKSLPVAYDGKRSVVWVQPALIVEIEYRAWTADNKLRHAAYKGLRERQDNADVYRLVD